jgi:cell division transport system ATP-binding protein
MSTDQLVVNLKQMQIFQNDTQILKDVNLEVKRRDFIYIIGRTGSGKSSFLKTLYGDLDFNSAEIANDRWI